jgi:hypothetical protein
VLSVRYAKNARGKLGELWGIKVAFSGWGLLNFRFEGLLTAGFWLV